MTSVIVIVTTTDMTVHATVAQAAPVAAGQEEEGQEEEGQEEEGQEAVARISSV